MAEDVMAPGRSGDNGVLNDWRFVIGKWEMGDLWEVERDAVAGEVQSDGDE